MDISVPFGKCACVAGFFVAHVSEDFYSLYFVVYETIITCGIPQPRVSDPI